MEYRKLSLPDLHSFYACRLRALETAPTAFLRDASEERARGPAGFEDVLSGKRNDNFIFGAVIDKKVIATIGIFRQDGIRLAHKATIWGMFVDRDQQGKGVGGRLLDLAVAHAKDVMKVNTIFLAVESENSSARRLYESRGFRSWGVEPKAMKYDGRYYDDVQLVLDME